MKRASAWSIDGIKPDIREAARETARRQGLTLSEWLNDIIIEHASELDIDADDMNSDDRLEAVTARLHQLGGRESRYDRTVRSRTHARDIHEEDDFSPRFARSSSSHPDELEERRQLKRQERSYERTPDRARDHLRLQDAEALLDAAIEAFDERATKSQRRTAQSVDAVTRLIKSHTRQRDDSLEVLSDISNRLSDIETQMTRQAVDEACGQGDRNSHLEALPVVARRLADIESHLAKRSPDDAYKPIKGALTRLEERLDSFALKPAASVQNENGLRRLENKLDALLRSSTPISSDAPIRKPAPQSAWRDSLQSTINEIGQHQRLLNADAPDWSAAPRRAQGSLIDARLNKTPPASHRGVDIHPLQNDIAALGVKLEAMRLQDLAKDLDRLKTEMGVMSAGLADLAPRDSVTAIESAIRNLTTRLETSREEGMRETLLKPLTELAEDLRHSLDGAGPRLSIDGLERDVKTISEKLENLGNAPHEPSVLARLQEQTQEIHHLLTHAAARPFSVEQVEKKIAVLAEQVDRQQTLAQHSLGPSEDDLSAPRLQKTHVESLNKIEGRLNDLAQKVERAISVPLSANAKMDPESLETVLGLLADKFVAAQDPKAGLGAIEALRAQISELAQRLERSDSGFSTLTSLQNSVGELFKHLEETRYAAAETAQTAARQAARDAVREVMEQPDLRFGIASNDSEITREIADLRSVQDEADRRTHSTLNAVHETLEKIVDRLAMLEEEIGDAQEASAAGLRLAEQSATFTRQRDGSIVANPAPQGPPEMPVSIKHHGGARSGEPQRGRIGSNASGDFLIEPGTLFPKSKEASVSQHPDTALGERTVEMPPAEPARSRTDFIAAARRAAQAAQAEQGQRDDMARPRRPMAETVALGSQLNVVAQARDFLFNHKRQVTLSIAALFLAVGAYAVVRTMANSKADMSMNAPNSSIHATVDAGNGRKADARAAVDASAPPPQMPEKNVPQTGDGDAKAVAPQARSETSPSGLPSMAMGASLQKPIAGSDPIVTSSIVAPKTNAVPSPDSPAALAALREQAEAGNAVAQYELASRYAEGRSMPRDFKLAADWYEKAEARGVAPAAYRLGSLYEKGFGVTRDFARAKSLYQKAAELGNSHAMHNLAVLIAEGGDGKPDYANAAIWFRKAAELGIRDSQYNLAILYARGLGVQQDLVQSFMWFSVAAAQGDEDAGKKREDVAAKLDAKSLAQAKASTDAFKPKETDRAANEVQAPPGGWEAAVPAPISPRSASTKPKISRL